MNAIKYKVGAFFPESSLQFVPDIEIEKEQSIIFDEKVEEESKQQSIKNKLKHSFVNSDVFYLDFRVDLSEIDEYHLAVIEVVIGQKIMNFNTDKGLYVDEVVELVYHTINVSLEEENINHKGIYTIAVDIVKKIDRAFYDKYIRNPNLNFLKVTK